MGIFQYEIFETFINDGHFEVTDAGPLHFPVKGISSFNNSVSSDNNGTIIRTESSSAHAIDAEIRDISNGKHLIEWIENVDDSHYMWPDIVRTTEENKASIRIGDSPLDVELPSSSSSKGSSRS